MLKAEHVCVTYDQLDAVKDVSFSLQPGQWLMLAGPNGAGKSTLVKALSASVPYTGEAFFQGRNIKTYKPRQLAKKIGVLSQRQSIGYGFTVEEVVTMGRYAYQDGFFAKGDHMGQEKINHALEMTGMTDLKDHSMLTLSGGEMQRGFLAQVFAQDPELLILDEPANHLDLPYQKQLFSLIGEWLKTPGRAVISVVHDLSLAKMYGTHGLLLDGGRLVSAGKVEDVFTRERLQAVYHMDVYGWMIDLLGQWS